MSLETLRSEVNSYNQPYVVYHTDPAMNGSIDYRQSFYELQKYHERDRSELLEQQRSLMDVNNDLEKEVKRLSNIIIRKVEEEQSTIDATSVGQNSTIQERQRKTSKRRIISDDDSSLETSEPLEKYHRRTHHPIPKNKQREAEIMVPKVRLSACIVLHVKKTAG
jgi:hypothetical protein